MPLIRTQKYIAASPKRVWRHLVDTEAYGAWNPLMRDFRGQLAPGAEIAFSLSVGPLKLPIDARVLRADGTELRWEGPRSALVGRMGHGSHYFRVTAEGEGTNFEHGEFFAGPLFESLWPVLSGRLGPSYARFNDALEARVLTD